MLLLPSSEVDTDGGHLLVLGLERLPCGDFSCQDLLELVRNLGGLSVLARPAAGRIHLDSLMCCRPDAVEAIKCGRASYGGGMSSLSVRFRIGLRYAISKML